MKYLLAVALVAALLSPVAAAAGDGVYVEFLDKSYPAKVLSERAYTTDGPTTKEFGLRQLRQVSGLKGNGITVCITDTGIDDTHEQLDNGKVLAAANFSDDKTTLDYHGHGTHVAGILAGDGRGVTKQAKRMVGVAPKASLLSAKVLNYRGSGTVQQIINGIEWCVAQNADVISMSLSTRGGENEALNAAANKAVSSGVVVVVAAGNTGAYPGFIGSPAAAALPITVGAISDWVGPDNGPWLAPFSTRGHMDALIKPDIVAPGVTVKSATSNAIQRVGYNPGGYHSWSGTSMATPFVAGVAALMLQQGVAPADVKVIIEQTAHAAGTPGKDIDWGSGIIDPSKALGGAGTNFPHHETWFVGGGPARDYYHWLWLDPSKPVAATVINTDGNEADSLSWPLYGATIYAVDDRGTVSLSLCPHIRLKGWCGSGAVGRQQTVYGMPKDLSDVQFPLDNGNHVFAMFPNTIGDPDESYWGRPWTAVVDIFYQSNEA